MEQAPRQFSGAAWAALSVPLLAAAALAAGVAPDRVFVGTAALSGAIALVYAALRVEPAWTLSLGLASMAFSGNWEHLGIPYGLDRPLIAAGLIAVVVRARPERPGMAALRGGGLETVHWVLLLAAAWAIGSAAWAGTLTTSQGLFGLLDRFGIVAFALFYVAPTAFAERRQRLILLGTLIGLGLYLGLTALFETLHLNALVVPKYILDPSIGIHLGRARGPFVEAVGDGMGLYAGGVAAAVGLVTWRDPLIRAVCVVTTGLCAAGIIFTLTRGVWLASAVATALAFASFPGVRRYLLPAAAGGGAMVLIVLASVPNLATSASERERQEAPIWVRINTDHAALRMVEQRPLAGFGWNRFEADSPRYFEQSGDTPLVGMGQGVHNVLLSHASELGLFGAFLWAVGFAMAIGGSLLRRGPPELRPWRIALLALAVHWVIVAAVTPLPYALPTALLFTWAGVVRSRSVRTQLLGTRPATSSA
jgi:putative inorganic carbon (hco3(-)) transporter